MNLILLSTQPREDFQKFVIHQCTRALIRVHFDFRKQALSLLAQMLGVLTYLHERRIVHRDIKPDNFLIANGEVPIQKVDLKLIDFGIARRFEEGEKMFTKCFTTGYAAPELLNGKSGYTGGQVDMWSIGVVVYVMLTGSMPWSDAQSKSSTSTFALPEEKVLCFF